MSECCDECGKTEGKLRLCTRCRQVRYCSTDCQRKAWTSGHKDKCSSSGTAAGGNASAGAAAPKPLSEETRRAIMELQGKIHTIQSSLRQTDAQIAACSKQMGSAKVTESALKEFPEDAKMFEAVGRMYLRKPREEIVRHLDETAESAEAKMKKLKDNKEYLLKNMGEAEEQARELVSRGPILRKMYKLVSVARSTLGNVTSASKCVADIKNILEVTPRLATVLTSQFHATPTLDRISSGRHFPSKNPANPTNHLTYEMSQEPQYIGVTKSWNTIHAGNFYVHERPMDKCNIAVEDMFIRRFMRGTWHNLFASEIIIKRKANMITLSGFVTRRMTPKKVYFLQGYTEELLSRILKCPVRMDIQTCRTQKDLIFKSI